MSLNEIEGGQEFVIDRFRNEDAEGVARLFRIVYGDGYAVKLVYNPAALIEAFEKRENMPAVARTGKGDIVGYCGHYRSSPNPDLYESGQGLVLPSYRTEQIFSKLWIYLTETASGQNTDAVFGEPVCNHLYSQKAGAAIYGADTETAIEIDLLPAEAFSAENSASGRVAAMPMFMIFKQKPQTINIPKVYKTQLDYIFSTKNIKLNDKHTFRESSGDAPPGIKSAFKTQVFEFAKVARIAFSEAGGDFEKVFEKIQEEMLLQNIVVTQVWLKLTTPWIGSIVDSLRSKGFFLGGVLPKWFGDDGLLMQKVTGRPNWEGIKLYSERAKNILKLIREDWEQAGRG